MPSFPTALDSLANPSAAQYTDDVGFELDLVISTLNDIVEALEAKAGIGASTPVLNTVLRGTGTGTSSWSAVTVRDRVDGTTSGPTQATSTYATIAEMTRTLTGLTVGSVIDATFTGTFYHASAAVIGTYAWSLDGAAEVGARQVNAPGSNYYHEVTLHRQFVATTSSHTIAVRWKAASGTLNAQGVERTLSVVAYLA